jgi:hypothetical protein
LIIDSRARGEYSGPSASELAKVSAGEAGRVKRVVKAGADASAENEWERSVSCMSHGADATLYTDAEPTDERRRRARSCSRLDERRGSAGAADPGVGGGMSDARKCGGDARGGGTSDMRKCGGEAMDARLGKVGYGPGPGTTCAYDAEENEMEMGAGAAFFGDG